MTFVFYDAAYPPTSPPTADGVCFYIGGDTPHVWTDAEIAAQHYRFRLPVFVRSNPQNASATGDVADAVTRLRHLRAPAGSLVAWDVEMAVDSQYIFDVHHALTMAGYTLIVYGSQSTVLRNDNPDGLYWGADWTGVPHLAGHNAMTQFVSFKTYDVSVAVESLPFWDTKPGAVTGWQEKMMKSLPTLANGAKGTDVKTVQALCCARGHITALDGNFGPQTELAVRAVQTAAGIRVDGIVGPQTWPALMSVS